MSVKFEKETTKTTAAIADAVSGKGGDDILHNVGEALTKGAFARASRPRNMVSGRAEVAMPSTATTPMTQEGWS